MSQSTKKFFPALTGFRAIAAWMIFVLHFFPFNNPIFPDFIKKFVQEFHIGVDMFFVLSGFLITYRYFGQKQMNLGEIRNYFINRFSRIYPMYFLITLGVFADFIIRNQYWNHEKTIEAILSFTMTKAIFAKYFFSAGISQGWTLTLEEMFYFTAPLYFLFIKKHKFWLIVIPVFIFVFGIFLRKITAVPENTWGFMQKNFSYYIFEFFAGMFLALVFTGKKNHLRSQGFFTYFGILSIVLYLFLNPFGYSSPDFIRASQTILLAGLGILPLFWGLLHEETFISKFLSTDFMVLLGKSSYIFYLIHKGFISIFIYEYVFPNVLAIFIILNIISILMFKYLEEPANQWIRRKYIPTKK
ncbi:acyltransferase family protein [Chryseobacterium koreense]